MSKIISVKAWRTINVPTAIMEKIEYLVSQKGSTFRNPSDFIVYAVRKELEKAGIQN